MVQEGWGQDCRCLELGGGNVVWGEPTVGILVSWAPVPLSQTLSVPECLPQKEAFGVGGGEVTSRSQQATYLRGWQLLRAASSCPLSLPSGLAGILPGSSVQRRCPGAPCWPAGHLHLGLRDTGLPLLLGRTSLPCYLTSFSPKVQG